MSEVETLITDAGLYSDGVYIENDFTDLNEWCKATAECEYEEADGDLVKHKINKMIELGIIEII